MTVWFRLIRRSQWVLAAALLSPLPAHGQLFSRTTEPGIPVVTLDPSTGALQRVAVTDETSYGAVSGLDPEGRRIFVLGLGPSGQTIITIDLRTGNVFKAPLATPVPDRPLELHFDPASRTLLTISNLGIVLQIDPETGSIRTEVGNLIIYPVTATAFDPVARRLFAINGETAQTLQILDLDPVQLTLHSIASVRYYGLLKWDPVARRLLSATSETGVPIVSIDPSTGSVVPFVVTGSPVLPYQSALDSAGRRLFFLSFVPAATGGASWSLYTVNLADGSVAVRALAPGIDYLFLQFVPLLITDVPVLGFAGLAALMVVLAVTGLFLAGRIHMSS